MLIIPTSIGDILLKIFHRLPIQQIVLISLSESLLLTSLLRYALSYAKTVLTYKIFDKIKRSESSLCVINIFFFTLQYC